MGRLTTNKPVSEMGMYELAHNCCYIGENYAARYRDFEEDVDIREFARHLCKVHEGFQMAADDDEFDYDIMEALQHGTDDSFGLIALFYRNLWAMADLRERLKEYEDLEEQGLLLKLPCKVGSIVYKIKKDLNSMKRETIEHNGHYYHRNINVYFITQVTFEIEDINSLGKTVFLTKAEAEKALEEMEQNHEDER